MSLRDLSRGLQVPFSSPSFWHYFHFLGANARRVLPAPAPALSLRRDPLPIGLCPWRVRAPFRGMGIYLFSFSSTRISRCTRPSPSSVWLARPCAVSRRVHVCRLAARARVPSRGVCAHAVSRRVCVCSACAVTRPMHVCRRAARARVPPRGVCTHTCTCAVAYVCRIAACACARAVVWPAHLACLARVVWRVRVGRHSDLCARVCRREVCARGPLVRSVLVGRLAACERVPSCGVCPWAVSGLGAYARVPPCKSVFMWRGPEVQVCALRGPARRAACGVRMACLPASHGVMACRMSALVFGQASRVEFASFERFSSKFKRLGTTESKNFAPPAGRLRPAGPK